jgi:hypothetical protein
VKNVFILITPRRCSRGKQFGHPSRDDKSQNDERSINHVFLSAHPMPKTRLLITADWLSRVRVKAASSSSGRGVGRFILLVAKQPQRQRRGRLPIVLLQAWLFHAR